MTEKEMQQLLQAGLLRWMIGEMKKMPDTQLELDLNLILEKLTKIEKSDQRMKA